MQNSVPLYVGYDPREAACYHVFTQSVIERASIPVSFHPLHRPMLDNFDGQKDGTNAFIYSRFLIPHLQNYSGWAIFADGDMTLTEDIAKLWELREECIVNKAVCVVKHDYRTKHPRKYIGTPMEADNTSYPRKNWSSVMLWNCGHMANRILTPEFVAEAPGSFLHRFSWLNDNQIGELPPEWNVLVGEQDASLASLLHYTCGAPGFSHYKYCDGAEHWHRARKRAMHMEGEG
jgi:lipopolysaccharide biosynthesis glycosyltransferase